MKKATAITCVFLDIGGVLLTDGWDRHVRKRAAATFKLDLAEMEDRDHLTFYTYEVRHGLKIAVVGNEGRELNSYRIPKFNLKGFVAGRYSTSQTPKCSSRS